MKVLQNFRKENFFAQDVFGVLNSLSENLDLGKIIKKLSNNRILDGYNWLNFLWR